MLDKYIRTKSHPFYFNLPQENDQDDKLIGFNSSRYLYGPRTPREFVHLNRIDQVENIVNTDPILQDDTSRYKFKNEL